MQKKDNVIEKSSERNFEFLKLYIFALFID